MSDVGDSPLQDTGTGTRRVARRTGRRAQVLRALKQADGPVDIATLAEQLHVHPNTVRFHLEALQRTGQVEQVAGPRSGPGRPAAWFRAVPRMDPTGPTQYRTLARILVADVAADALSRERAIEAGRRWGAMMAAEHASPGREERAGVAATNLAPLMSVLEELDFDPEIDPPGYPGAVGLRHCPFLDLVEDYPGTVCAIHLGLMQGVMQAHRNDTEVQDLTPFSEPDLCVAHLGTAAR